ncbi:MAG: hypothetical protein SNJ71_06250 [Bacteroidales bacterium]
MTKKARALFTSQKRELVPALAIIMNGFIHKTIINIYFKIGKPLTTSKVFFTETHAREWLNKRISNYANHISLHK